MSMPENVVFFAKENVKVPQQSKLLQAGKDLFFTEEFTLKPREKKKINLKVGAVVPKGHFGLIVQRSSSHEHWVEVHVGVLDGYYIADINLSLTNHCYETTYIFQKDTSIAQLIYIPHHQGASVLAHPDQLDLAKPRGNFPSGSSGNVPKVRAIKSKSDPHDKPPGIPCVLCGHVPCAESDRGDRKPEDLVDKVDKPSTVQKYLDSTSDPDLPRK